MGLKQLRVLETVSVVFFLTTLCPLGDINIILELIEVWGWTNAGETLIKAFTIGMLFV